MNVEGDDSRRRLNYYSRSSPKKHKHPPRHSAHSPLLPHPPTHHRQLPSPRIISTPRLSSSFRLELLSASRSSISEQILIEDADDDEILIVDSAGPEETQVVGPKEIQGNDKTVKELHPKKEEILIS